MFAPAVSTRLLALLVAFALAGCSLMLDSDNFDGKTDDGAEDGAQPPDDDGGGGDDGAGGDDGSDGSDGSDGADPAPDGGSSADAGPDAGGEPVDVAGAYTVTVTNGANECGFAGFTEGAVATGVPLTVAQEATAVTADVEGPVGTFLDLALGSRTFEGDIAGSELALTLFGTNPFMLAACTYTVNGEVSATIDGDLIEGSAQYRASTNGSPDCGVLETCVTTQQFNGTRPP
jgi:hypothetical protein